MKCVKPSTWATNGNVQMSGNGTSNSTRAGAVRWGLAADAALGTRATSRQVSNAEKSRRRIDPPSGGQDPGSEASPTTLAQNVAPPQYPPRPQPWTSGSRVCRVPPPADRSARPQLVRHAHLIAGTDSSVM